MCNLQNTVKQNTFVSYIFDFWLTADNKLQEGYIYIPVRVCLINILKLKLKTIDTHVKH